MSTTTFSPFTIFTSPQGLFQLHVHLYDNVPDFSNGVSLDLFHEPAWNDYLPQVLVLGNLIPLTENVKFMSGQVSFRKSRYSQTETYNGVFITTIFQGLPRYLGYSQFSAPQELNQDNNKLTVPVSVMISTDQ